MSLLKKKVGDPSLIQEALFIIDQEDKIFMKPKEVLEYRQLIRRWGKSKVWQALILWDKSSRDEVTWKDYDELEKKYSHLILKGKDVLQKKEMSNPLGRRPRAMPEQYSKSTIGMVWQPLDQVSLGEC